jgi:hypothetical protein
MADQTLAEEIRTFVESYMDAFDAANGPEIVALYHIPYVTVRGDGSLHCFQDKEVAQGFFQKVADTYLQDDCRRSRYFDLEVTPIGARSALATLEWEQLPEDGSSIRRWRQSYNLLRDRAAWKVLTSTFHQSGI